jgi:hypothetical protein
MTKDMNLRLKAELWEIEGLLQIIISVLLYTQTSHKTIPWILGIWALVNIFISQVLMAYAVMEAQKPSKTIEKD